MADIGTETQSAFDARQINTDVLPEWFAAYAKTNKDFPMAPAATDTLIGQSVVEAIVLGKCSVDEFRESKFSSKQINALISLVTDAHRNAGVNVVPEGKSRGEEVVFSTDRFDHGWVNIKTRVLRAMTLYVKNLNTDLTVLPEDVTGEQNILELDKFFTDAKYGEYKDALVDLYAAAAAPLRTDKYKAHAADQHSIYSGGTQGFKVTEPLTAIITDIDGSVNSEWEKRYKGKIPEPAKTVFIDVITRRNDQPTN